MAITTEIESVHADDVAYELALAKRFTDQVGFLTRDAVEHYAANGGVLRARENQEPAGFLVFTRTKGDQPRVAQIYQAAIQLDAQRRHHGLALVERAVSEARAAGAHVLQCWCATDLDANSFWQAAGFSHVAARPGGRRRQRRHFLWQRALKASFRIPIWNRDAQEGPGSTQPHLFDLRDLPHG